MLVQAGVFPSLHRLRLPSRCFNQVSNVYVIASGLPSRLPREQHARFLAEFCVDVLHVLQTGLPASVDPVSACVGLHVGPVTAGLIGRTRRYYRIFGDTVNVGELSVAVRGVP